MNRLLQLKHWQLFVLTVAAPFVIHSFVLIATIAGLRDPGFPLLSISMLAIAGSAALLLAWLWAAGTRLYALLPAGESSMNLPRFRTLLICAGTYFACFVLFVMSRINGASFSLPAHFTDMPFLSLLALVPVHCFALFCLLHSVWFVAKTLNAVERQAPVKTEQYVADGCLLWFYPIGVWFIQPRINRLADEGFGIPGVQGVGN